MPKHRGPILEHQPGSRVTLRVRARAEPKSAWFNGNGARVTLSTVRRWQARSLHLPLSPGRIQCLVSGRFRIVRKG
jgi:hypothetical protein